MSETAALIEGQPETKHPPAEPVRLLASSPLGAIGIESIADRVTRIQIVPGPKERHQYSPLSKASRSDFLDEALGRLSEYFAGARRQLQIEYSLNESGLDEYAYRVLLETTKIPYGATRTHQKLATATGRVDSYRLVRSILMANPLPLVIPCHRVIPRRGGAGSYIAATRKKDWLRRWESRGLRTPK